MLALTSFHSLVLTWTKLLPFHTQSAWERNTLTFTHHARVHACTHTHTHTHTHGHTQTRTHPRTHIPLGEGMHIKHFPQLHLPPPAIADFLLMLSRLVSLAGGLMSSGVSPHPGRAVIRLSMESVTTPDCIR